VYLPVIITHLLKVFKICRVVYLDQAMIIVVFVVLNYHRPVGSRISLVEPLGLRFGAWHHDG
jgi:hypothetical protein